MSAKSFTEFSFSLSLLMTSLKNGQNGQTCVWIIIIVIVIVIVVLIVIIVFSITLYIHISRTFRAYKQSTCWSLVAVPHQH